MIVGEEVINKGCYKKLGYYDVNKIKIDEEEEIIVKIEMNSINNLMVYHEVLRNCMPMGLRVLRIENILIRYAFQDSFYLLKDDFNNLTDTIEEIYIKEVGGTIHKFPKRLKILDAPKLSCLNLGEELERANISSCDKIPKSLKELNIEYLEDGNDTENIEKLKIERYKGGKLNICLKELEVNGEIKDLRHLVKLEKLKIMCKNTDILDNLPRNLEELEYLGTNWLEFSKMNYKELDNLPCKLRILKLQNVNSNLDFLPAIKVLDFRGKGKFENLPSSLEDFTYNGYKTRINKEGLKNLKFYKTYIIPEEIHKEDYWD